MVTLSCDPADPPTPSGSASPAGGGSLETQSCARHAQVLCLRIVKHAGGTMPFVVSNIGLEMPDEVPTSYEVVHTDVQTRQWPKESKREFGESWNSVSYRYRAVCYHGDMAEASLVEFGPGPPPDEWW